MSNKKINILYYEPSSGFGGSSGALVTLIKHLDTAKFKPIFVIKSFGPQFAKLKDVEFIKLSNYSEPEKKSLFVFLSYFIRNIIPEAVRLYYIIIRRKISIIHTNTSILAAIPSIIAAKLSRIHCVCHFRGTRNLLKREKFFARWVDRFIVLNKSAYDYFRHTVDSDKVKLIYDGIDFNEFNPGESGLFRTELNLDSLQTVGLIGRIIPGKGQKEFVLSAKEVLRVRPKTKFLIVGDVKGDTDYYYNEVKEMVKKENLDENIIFTGWRTDIKNILTDLDILVFSTTTFPEGLPNTIIEAMALEKPVVSTNIPGPADITLDGETGFLVPPGDIKAMSDKILYLLEHPEVAREIGKKARERVKKYFDIKIIAEDIGQEYALIKSSIKTKLAISKIIKECFGYLFYYTGLFWFFLRAINGKRQCLILMYHRINKDSQSCFSGLQTEIFEKQIRFLSRFFKFITFDELIRLSETKEKIRDNLAIITFDDGYKNTYFEALPILNKYQLPATVFLTTGVLGNGGLIWTDKVSYLIRNTVCPELTIKVNGSYRKFFLEKDRKEEIALEIKEILKNMDNDKKEEVLQEMVMQINVELKNISDSEKMLNWNEIEDMDKEGIEFGGHTVNHSILTKITLENAWKEIKESKEEIEKHIKNPVITFCYPNGTKEDFNQEIKDLLKKAGYQCAVTAIDGTFDYSDNDLFEIKRFPTYEERIPLFAVKILLELMR